MPPALRRLAASVTALALALGGVALAAAPAQAAEYAPTATWPIPTDVEWGDIVRLDSYTLAPILPGSTSFANWILEWHRSDTDAVIATGLTYTVDGAAAGAQVYGVLRGNAVGGIYDGYAVTILSNRTDVVPVRTFSVPSLSVSGEAIAGNALSVDGGGWGATPSSYTWEWRRVSDDALVASGTGATPGSYTVTSADVAAGSRFYARVTAHLLGYTDAVGSTTFSQAAHLGSFANVGAVPAVAGTGRLGSSFTAFLDTSGITPAPTTVNYRWHTSDGTIVGTGPSFAPTNTLLGQALYATAVLSRADYNDHTTLGSASTANVVLAQFENVPVPTVSGTGRLGTSFTTSLVTAGITPMPTGVTFRWHTADGTIVGTGASFAPTNVLLGETLYATALLTAVDTADHTTLGSAETAAVSLAQFENVPIPTVSGTGRLGTSFTASLDTAGVTPVPTGVTFRWHTADGTIVGTGAGFAPTNVLLGETLYATALLTAVDTADHTTLGSAETAAVALADQTPGAAPVITGRNALGGTLTASVDTSGWSPVPDSFSYQWFLADGTPIPDADEATLVMTADLVGEEVYVVATAHAVDHHDHATPSTPTDRIARPVLAASASTVTAGGTITVTGSGLLLGEQYTVELHSSPLLLGTITSDVTGTISSGFTIPVSTPAGTHTIVLLRDGVELATLALTVEAAPAVIAATGADTELSTMSLLAALTLLTAGCAMVAARRASSRRSRSASCGTRPARTGPAPGR